MKSLVLILALSFATAVGTMAQVDKQQQDQPKKQNPQMQQTDQRTRVEISDLPKAISTDLRSNHKDWTAVQAFKLGSGGERGYEVVVKNNENTQIKLMYDKEGKFLRQEPMSGDKPVKKDEPQRENPDKQK